MTLYLLAGAYDEGVEEIHPFYSDTDIKVMEYVIEHPAEYERVLRSLGHPKTYQEFDNALSNSYVDGDSKMGWVLFEYSPNRIVKLDTFSPKVE